MNAARIQNVGTDPDFNLKQNTFSEALGSFLQLSVIERRTSLNAMEHTLFLNSRSIPSVTFFRHTFPGYPFFKSCSLPWKVTVDIVNAV